VVVVIKVAVVDDHPLLREGVVAALSHTNDIEVVGSGSCASDAVDLHRAHSPDIVVLDIYMPGGGLNAAAKILASARNVKVIMLTASDDFADLRQAMKIGALGFLQKGESAAELTRAIEQVNHGNVYVSSSLLLKMARNGYLDDFPLESFTDHSSSIAPELTQREIDILELLSTGQTNKQIAASCSIKTSTVKSYISALFGKLQVKNRVEAAEAWRTLNQTRDLDKIKNV